MARPPRKARRDPPSRERVNAPYDTSALLPPQRAPVEGIHRLADQGLGVADVEPDACLDLRPFLTTLNRKRSSDQIGRARAVRPGAFVRRRTEALRWLPARSSGREPRRLRRRRAEGAA